MSAAHTKGPGSNCPGHATLLAEGVGFEPTVGTRPTTVFELPAFEKCC